MTDSPTPPPTLLLSVYVDSQLLTRWRAMTKALGRTQKETLDEALAEWVRKHTDAVVTLLTE